MVINKRKILLRKRTITTFLSRKFIITRSSIAFEDFLGSSKAPQVMPPCCMAHCLSSVGDYIHLCNTLPIICRRMSAVMLLTMEFMSTFLRLIADDILPVLHTACPLWVRSSDKWQVIIFTWCCQWRWNSTCIAHCLSSVGECQRQKNHCCSSVRQDSLTFSKYSSATSFEFYFCKSSVSGSLSDMAKLAKTSKNIWFYIRGLVLI